MGTAAAQEGILMSLLLGAHCSAAGGPLKAVERARYLESDAMQIFTKNERQWKGRPLDPAETEAFRRARAEAGLIAVVSHDSYLINLASGKPDIAEKSVAAFRDELERADLLGLDGVVSHPGSHTGDGIEAGIARFAERLGAILAAHAGRALALLEVTAGQGTSLGSSFGEIAAILAAIPAKERARVGVCLDTCHAFAAGYDLSTKTGFSAMWREFDRLIGMDRLKCLHLNDSKRELGSRVDRHEHLGKGALGELPFRLLMTSEEFRRVPKIIETEKSDDLHEDVENLAFLRRLAR